MAGASKTMQSVRAGSISGYAELVTSLGQDPLQLLAEAGLPRECLLPDREDDYLPLSRFEARPFARLSLVRSSVPPNSRMPGLSRL